ncbi:pleckstrin-2 isoform X1 [Scyliorhinus canicula]|uniref:pleckstrin-2 isoform X1 n=2 Tax=Scyliorhinus canicula TaxID=7830 RepID=UPI0018F4CC07|nr:pleckstrin-2 isoform X1 [Scyliorhinus canicula]
MQGETAVSREGFLVKRGHIVHNWKVRWFILSKDKIHYYKIEGGKKEARPRRTISLEGCTLHCPCMEYANRPLLIKLKAKNSVEHFLEASSREHRDSWAADIEKTIRASNPDRQEQPNSPAVLFDIPANVCLSHLIIDMQETGNGIKEMTNGEYGNTYKLCFTGATVIDWLVSRNVVQLRSDGVTIASLLTEDDFIIPVGDKSTKATWNMAGTEVFLDDSTALYCFAKNERKTDNSNDDIEIPLIELSGKIVKQGFLMKQGHKRKNWKVRRFVLRSEPSHLHYYDPCKEKNNQPVGGLSLRGCLVSALEDNGIAPGIKGNVQGNLFKIITTNDVHYYIQAGSRAERSEWIQAIKQLA